MPVWILDIGGPIVYFVYLFVCARQQTRGLGRYNVINSIAFSLRLDYNVLNSIAFSLGLNPKIELFTVKTVLQEVSSSYV